MRLMKYMSQQPDQHYIDQVLNGDTGAYAVLIDRYKHMVYTICFRILKNREDSEEVSQDVFIKAYKALEGFKGDAAFTTWLYKIAYRTSLDHLRKHRKRKEPDWANISESYNLVEMEGVMDRLLAEERKATIKRALDVLSEEDRLIITLFYYEELSLKEISEILEITQNAAKVRLFRGRERLARILKQLMNAEKVSQHGRI